MLSYMVLDSVAAVESNRAGLVRGCSTQEGEGHSINKFWAHLWYRSQ